MTGGVAVAGGTIGRRSESGRTGRGAATLLPICPSIIFFNLRGANAGKNGVGPGGIVPVPPQWPAGGGTRKEGDIQFFFEELL